VTAFLTDEQKAKWAKEKEDRKNKMKAKAKGKKGEVEEDIED
jgi:membrane protein implicated in regulation of membrane protease activity